MVNEELGGNLAARHLLDQGARHLIYLAGNLELTAISRRLSGVQKAVASAGAGLHVVEAPNLKIGHVHQTIMLDPQLIPRRSSLR
jgi:LacI family transcriptional regulator